jgi:hypothetical protein
MLTRLCAPIWLQAVSRPAYGWCSAGPGSPVHRAPEQGAALAVGLGTSGLEVSPGSSGSGAVELRSGPAAGLARMCAPSSADTRPPEALVVPGSAPGRARRGAQAPRLHLSQPGAETGAVVGGPAAADEGLAEPAPATSPARRRAVSSRAARPHRAASLRRSAGSTPAGGLQAGWQGAAGIAVGGVGPSSGGAAGSGAWAAQAPTAVDPTFLRGSWSAGQGWGWHPGSGAPGSGPGPTGSSSGSLPPLGPEGSGGLSWAAAAGQASGPGAMGPLLPHGTTHAGSGPHAWVAVPWQAQGLSQGGGGTAGLRGSWSAGDGAAAGMPLGFPGWAATATATAAGGSGTADPACGGPQLSPWQSAPLAPPGPAGSPGSGHHEWLAEGEAGPALQRNASLGAQPAGHGGLVGRFVQRPPPLSLGSGPGLLAGAHLPDSGGLPSGSTSAAPSPYGSAASGLSPYASATPSPYGPALALAGVFGAGTGTLQGLSLAAASPPGSTRGEGPALASPGGGPHALFRMGSGAEAAAGLAAPGPPAAPPVPQLGLALGGSQAPVAAALLQGELRGSGLPSSPPPLATPRLAGPHSGSVSAALTANAAQPAASASSLVGGLHATGDSSAGSGSNGPALSLSLGVGGVLSSGSGSRVAAPQGTGSDGTDGSGGSGGTGGSGHVGGPRARATGGAASGGGGEDVAMDDVAVAMPEAPLAAERLRPQGPGDGDTDMPLAGTGLGGLRGRQPAGGAGSGDRAVGAGPSGGGGLAVPLALALGELGVRPDRYGWPAPHFTRRLPCAHAVPRLTCCPSGLGFSLKFLTRKYPPVRVARLPARQEVEMMEDDLLAELGATPSGGFGPASATGSAPLPPPDSDFPLLGRRARAAE